MTELAAKQQRAKDLRDRARLLGSLGRRGGASATRDYLSQVESSDVDALQNTAASRAAEYYQRRSQLTKELSAQAIAENYFNTQATEQLAGASRSQANVSQTYGNILSSLATRQQLDQDAFFNEATALNDLLRTQTGALNQYGNLASSTLANIGQRGISASGQAIGGYSNILGNRKAAAGQPGNLGIGLLGALSQQAQTAWQQYANERDFEESQFRDRRDFTFKTEGRDFDRQQTQDQSASLQKYLEGLRGSP